MVRITAIDPAGIGAELELEAGDTLLSINGQGVHDLIDFQLLGADDNLLLEVRKSDGEIWELHIEKDAEEDLGITLEHPEPTQCGNNCLFCFVHQLPKGMRRSLYVKDEDYRFSFLYGSYVTLTNIGEAELERIISQRLSPLYISVHSTREELRRTLLGRAAPAILPLLQRLAAADIEMHTQIVLCPGLNDGPELARTIDDLFALHPAVRSLAVVPVGLTGFRQRLPELRVPSRDEARAALELIAQSQRRFVAATGKRFVFAADELFLRAEAPFPALDEYEDLPQWENGVGMIASFREQAEDVVDEAEPLPLKSVSLLTGESAATELSRFAARLSAKTGVALRVFAIRNDFFGGAVTVTGLLTAGDIIAQLRGQDLGQALLVPEVVLREGDELLLDDLSLTDVANALGVRVEAVASNPWGVLTALENLSADLSSDRE